MTPVTPAKRAAQRRQTAQTSHPPWLASLHSSPYPVPNNFVDPELVEAVNSGQAGPVIKCATRLIGWPVAELTDKAIELEAARRGAEGIDPGPSNVYDHGIDYSRGIAAAHEEEVDDDTFEAEARARGEDGYWGKLGKWHNFGEFLAYQPWDTVHDHAEPDLVEGEGSSRDAELERRAWPGEEGPIGGKDADWENGEPSDGQLEREIMGIW